MNISVINLVTPKAAAKQELLFNKPGTDFFLVQRVPDRGMEQRESGKTVLYSLIISIILIRYIIIRLSIKMRTIPAETRNGNPTDYFVKAGLHYDNYRSKLVHFGAQKIFSMLQKALA